jgi:putative hemolysin
VYEGNPDKVVGIFYVKDLMRWLAGEGRAGKSFELRSVVRPAIFVPETKTIRELLSELMEKKVHIAVVADEYGGVAGLVTIEDILEEIVGPIQDEYEHGEETVPDVIVDGNTKTAEIDARAYIANVNYDIRQLGIEIPASEDYDTVGGFVTVTSGRIPAAGERLQFGDLIVTVLEAGPTRVARIRLEAAPEAARAGQEQAETENVQQTPGPSEVRTAD